MKKNSFCLQINGINYVLNVSTNCPRPPHVQEGHFYRIPISDNYNEKILPFFPDAFQFLGKLAGDLTHSLPYQ